MYWRVAIRLWKVSLVGVVAAELFDPVALWDMAVLLNPCGPDRECQRDGKIIERADYSLAVLETSGQGCSCGLESELPVEEGGVGPGAIGLKLTLKVGTICFWGK